MEHFRIASANRRQFDYEDSCSLSAVNAVSLARDIPWEKSYHLLIDQAIRYGLMPDDAHCVRNMLVEAGYAPVPGFKRLQGYDQLSRYLTENYPGITSGLVFTAGDGNRKKRVCAIRKHDRSTEGFYAMDTRAEPRTMVQLWLPWSETGKEQPRVQDPRSIRTPQSQPYPEHEGYRCFQPNPRNNSIGDCVIRAYAAVFGVSWEEALEMVAKSNGYTTTTLNGLETYRYLASEYGFTYHDRPARNGRGVTGEEFCAYLTAVCKNGERVFAEAGLAHVVGIIPVDTSAGKRYAIMDSWDSSGRKIGKYFVYVPEKKSEPVQEEKPVQIAEGARISHPHFGEGTIESIAGNTITIVFSNGERKTLSTAWALRNCGG